MTKFSFFWYFLVFLVIVLEKIFSICFFYFDCRVYLIPSFFVQIFLSHHAELVFFKTTVRTFCATCAVNGYPCRGGSKIFSSGGGGGGFSKGRPNWFSFFRSTKLIFWALLNHSKDPIFTKFSAPHAKFWKNRPKKAFLGNFWKILTKKSARAPLSKFVYIGAKGAFRKTLGSVTKNGYLKILQRGDPLGLQRVKSLKKEGRPPPPPPP